jgi:phage tail sheath protein FI
LNVKKAGDIAGSDYGQFSLQVRQTGLNDNNLTRDNVLEQWDSLNFNPKSTNFFARRIGDRYVTIDSNGKLTYNGDWNNRSKHIYVSDFSAISDGSIPVALVPMGHAAIQAPLEDALMPNWIFKVTQSNAQDEFDSNVLYGVDYKNADAGQYLVPVNDFTSGLNVSMSLENMLGHDDASTLGTTEGTDWAAATSSIKLTTSHMKQRKFVVPFQGGFDGDNPANPKLTGASITNVNTQGFDISSATATGAVAYKKAINAVSNPDEFDINMLITPGIIHDLHPKITNHAIAKCEERGDAFYVFDCGIQGGSIASATAAISALDTNYAATYYPWVKIVDRATALPVWVPPSVVLPGVIAFTDQVAHEWFAPAGLNRGGLTTVLEAQTRLTHDERDELYEARVNPIASFPGQGVVVWGQKTLQGRPSALDRVNVRRLLIRLKKFIASSSRYLVFEQNTSATRNRFLNIVNPFLESVQSNSGLSAFKVVMDDSNNTPDVIDRNQLVGQIFIQPTRTAEFIVLDFVVLPTGATFPA